MSAVNDAFDSSTTERFAFAFTLPPQLFALLGGMALLGMAALGFQLGLRGNPHRILSVMLTVLWTVVVVQIFDLASPRVGGLRTSAAVYDWTIQGFHGGLQIPPLPSGSPAPK
jgi:predicted benzoate:H+ symporter BenE